MSRKMHADANSPPLQMEIVETWIHKYGRHFLYGVTALGVLLILFFRLFTNNQEGARQDYQLATITFQRVQNSLGASREDLTTMHTLLERRPELHARYDGALAQILIQQNRNEEAGEYSQNALHRLHDRGLSSLFHEFTATTLLMGKGEFLQAYDQNRQLVEKLDHYSKNQNGGNATFEPYQELYAYALLRQAALAQKLGKSQDELHAWSTVEKFLKNDKRSSYSDLSTAIQQNFQLGTVTLWDYIKHRRKVLSV